MNCYFLCCFSLILVTHLITTVLSGTIYCITVGMFIHRRNYKHRKPNNITHKSSLLTMAILQPLKKIHSWLKITFSVMKYLKIHLLLKGMRNLLLTVRTLAMRVMRMWANVNGRVSGVALSKHCFRAPIPLLSQKKHTFLKRNNGTSGSCK